MHLDGSDIIKKFVINLNILPLSKLTK